MEPVYVMVRLCKCEAALFNNDEAGHMRQEVQVRTETSRIQEKKIVTQGSPGTNNEKVR